MTNFLICFWWRDYVLVLVVPQDLCIFYLYYCQETAHQKGCVVSYFDCFLGMNVGKQKRNLFKFVVGKNRLDYGVTVFFNTCTYNIAK